MDYGTATTWPEQDSSWIGADALTDYVKPVRPLPKRTWLVSVDTSAFMADFSPAAAPATPDSSTLPGELLSPAVTRNLNARRTLKRVFEKLAEDGAITHHTLAALNDLVEAL